MPGQALSLLVGLAVLGAGFELDKLRGYQVLWQIGDIDGSPGEFALAPDGARQFLDAFPDDPVYVVGESRPAQWPFIHPSEADTAWGGTAHHQFKILFDLDRRPSGRYALLIALTDAHESLGSEMCVAINSREYRCRLRTGAGRAYYGDLAHGSPQNVWIEFDAEDLRRGRNEIGLTVTEGSWVAYDAVVLLQRDATVTAGRHPKAQPHALTASLGPLHQDFGTPQGWDTNLLVLDGQAGWLNLLGLEGHSASLPDILPDEHFTVGFDLRVVQGKMGLEYSLDHAAQPYWRVEWDEQGVSLAGSGRPPVALDKGTWRLLVENCPGGAHLTVATTTKREPVEVGTAAHVPGPPGRLRFVVLDDVAHAYVTNLARSVTLSATAEQSEGPGARWVRLTLRTQVPHGEVSAAVTALDAAGGELARRTLAWRGKEPEAHGLLNLPSDAKPARVRVELRQTGRRGPLWVLHTPVLGGEGASPKLPRRPAGTYSFATDDGWVVGNECFEALIPADRGLGPSRLISRVDGRSLANLPYSYAPLGVEDDARVASFDLRREKGGLLRVTIGVTAGPVTISHQLVFPPKDDSFAERLTFTVDGAARGPVDLSHLRCGWVRSIGAGDGSILCPELAEVKLIPVPWRRDTWGAPNLLDLTVPEAVWRQGWYRETGGPEKTWTPEHGAEAWLWAWDKAGTLILKLNESLMEWSLLDRVIRDGQPALRFGGCGAWHGDPQSWACVSPGQTVTSGWTYFCRYEGDWREGFYVFRDFLAEHGHGCPFHFDPPVHWNELYDNPLWHGPDTPERRKKHYTLRDMLWEAEKAREAGCQALYLDPGWDTVFGSHLWDEARLGPVRDFIRRMNDEYGLKVSLHTPVAEWASRGGGGKTYPPEAWRVGHDGALVQGSLCSGSKAYLEEQTRRLVELADAGVVYFMFDGSAYTGPCFSPDHGHPVPFTRDDHVHALEDLARRVHKAHPEVLIEQHDQILAGVPSVYAPVYLGHGRGGWDERWANEYMWQPLQDLKQGRALSLYYYNLAYNLPQYIHIDLRDDNESCLAFWWYASTCRHLGIGGTHPDGRNWLSLRRHMAEYLRLQDYFKRGVFYGIDEEVHVHVLPDRGAVVNLFNLSPSAVVRRVFLDLARMDLRPEGRVYVRGANHIRLGDGVEIEVAVPPWSAKMVEILVGR